MRVLFVVGNAGHHAAIAAPVARELASTGAHVEVLSVAELRALPSPASAFPGARTWPLVPGGLRRRVPASLTGAAPTSTGRAIKRAVRALAWATLLRARTSYVLARARPDVVAVMNDVAFPYDAVCAAARRCHIPVVLLQEGVRFPLPTEERTHTPYGATELAAVCVWGERSAAHFRAVADGARVEVTGNPRYDTVDVERTRAEGRALRDRLGLTGRLVGFLSNPIDDQGFCTTDEKLALFERFLAAAAPALNDYGATVVVKLHPREHAPAFAEVAQRSPAKVVMAADAPILPLLSTLDAGLVLTSTVGLEAMLFDVAIGALEIPRAGHVFDYVASGAALPLHADDRAKFEVGKLLNGFAAESSATRARYVDGHLAHRGQAAQRMAAVLRTVARGTNRGT
ncbi:MAG: hypothetical protein HYS27_09150 [Deltaproteobacteria bacterium]|nr:hypothetical protein [Deltaproteobacteria bacterium]